MHCDLVFCLPRASAPVIGHAQFPVLVPTVVHAERDRQELAPGEEPMEGRQRVLRRDAQAREAQEHAEHICPEDEFRNTNRPRASDT